jgi:membrane associated rhomboid family serine protease
MSHQPSSGPSREPMFNAPSVVVGAIAVIVAIHILRSVISAETDFRILIDFGFIPARLLAGLGFESIDAIVERASAGPDGGYWQMFAQLVLGDGAAPWTLVTYAVLHGSWAHLGANAMWLLAFGSAVARRFGAARFLVLCLVCSVAGALAHLASRPFDVVPMIGASGAISGVMAAAARFVFRPDWGHLFGIDLSADRMPAESLGQLVRNRRALAFVAVWFAINLAFGVTALPLGLAEGGIAWEAHIGGFVAGLLLFPLFDRVHPRGGVD